MTNRWKFSTYILISLLAGALFAGVSTHITYTCPPHASDVGSYYCVSFEKAVMHPADLASNMQGSLTRFMTKLLVASVVVLMLLIAGDRAWAWTKKRHHSSQPSDQQ